VEKDKKMENTIDPERERERKRERERFFAIDNTT